MIESLIRRGDFCWHCHVGIAAYPVNIAIEKKIPLIFYGEPSSEYSSYYNYEEFEKNFEHFLLNLDNYRPAKLVDEFLTFESYQKKLVSIFTKF